MKTKRIKYTENMCVLFDKDTKNKIIEIATDANISQGEFVRDAVDYYLNILTTAKQKQDYKHEVINSIKSDD